MKKHFKYKINDAIILFDLVRCIWAEKGTILERHYKEDYIYYIIKLEDGMILKARENELKKGGE